MQRWGPTLAAAARRHAPVVDGALGVLVAVYGVLSLWTAPTFVSYDFRDPDGLGVGLALLAGAAVAVRSRWPVAALVVASAASLAPLQLGYAQGAAGIGPLLVLYTVAVRRTARTSGLATLLLGVAVGAVLSASPLEPSAGDWFGNTFILVTGWALGRSVRSRRAYTAQLEERNRALLEAREARSEALAADDRARVAREMQDLVTHNLTVLTVQSGAARRLLRTDPDTAEQLLAGVEEAGRDAVEEMRRILGVLRAQGDGADRRPQPRLADLEELLARARQDGLQVELSVAGTPAPVEAGVELTAYRLVQEALRNALQHAGRAVAWVRLDWRPGQLVLVVEDDGRGPRLAAGDDDATGGGRGLQSLRERVDAYGGRLRAGPRSGGGFTVTATLPTACSRRVPAHGRAS